MCFNVSQTASKVELSERYHAAIDEYMLLPDSAFIFNAFEHPAITAVVSEENKRSLKAFSWGLIPAWIKTEEEAQQIRMKTANAMSETVFEKPSFRKAIKSSRCIVPVTGFFEWMHKDKKTFPHYIYPAQGRFLNLAGIYETWVNQKSGEEITSVSILTTSANELMSQIHNVKQRMPVILNEDEMDVYLKKDAEKETLQKLFKPASEDLLKAHTISRLITSREKDPNTEELIKPYSYPDLNIQNTLF